ncbi:hypothetical protein FQR65_LT16448 [Abscondita terminalis]|nr:hypothetical protein FQR65_LT16448 [Abscondita terminalis]
MYRGTGRRKSSVAQVVLTPGKGQVLINGKAPLDYFPFATLVQDMEQPLVVTSTKGEFDIKITVRGGGFTGQAGACRLGIARAILSASEDYKKPLRKAGLLTRDARIENTDKMSFNGVSRMVMLDRYSQKDKDLISLKVNDIVITTVKPDPIFPTRGIGIIKEIKGNDYTIEIEDQYVGSIDPTLLKNKSVENVIIKNKYELEKPLELFFEQIAKRVGASLADTEEHEIRKQFTKEFSDELAALNIIPAGRVLYGAGSGSEVTYFNCYVMPFIKDDRTSISHHRAQVTEIMSRGGGVGSNGSTLRPKGAPAKGVGELIRQEANNKLRFEYLSESERKIFKTIIDKKEQFDSEMVKEAQDKISLDAEPGIFFLDQANDMTNAQGYGQKVVATNPCGEQPLAPYSVCNLSAVNLSNFVDKKTKEILYDKLAKTVAVCVRMQDNVIDATPYFLEPNQKQALGIKYGSKESLKIIDKVFETIAISAYKTSIDLAKEKGSFPFLKDRQKFIESGYIKKLPKEIREDILKFGIRNSHLLTVAPTGSTGTMVGCSTGLEPYFAFSYFRSGRLELNPSFKNKELPDYFVSAGELKPEDHVNVQCYKVEQVEDIYMQLYKGGAKGGTVYVDGSRDSQVLSLENVDNSVEDASNTLQPLEEKNVPKKITQEQKIGNDVGDLCPMCTIGTLIEAAGCITCGACGAQLKCGL